MNLDRLTAALDDADSADAATLIRSYLLPQVTELTEDRIGHDLAPDTLEFGRGVFMPASDRVMIEVDAAYSFLGNARCALLMVIGQPDAPGATLYDSGGAPVGDTQWHSMGSVNGESGWASTTHRRIVVDVDPARPVTWQLVGAITGGAYTMRVPHATRIAVTPDGSKAFVTSAQSGTVTPIVLGQPGYSMFRDRAVEDVSLEPVVTGGAPRRLAAGDRYVVVCDERDPDGQVLVLTTSDHEVLHRVTLRDGPPTDCVITPDGMHAVVTTTGGRLARVALASGAVTDAVVGGRLQGVAVTSDSGAAFVADPDRSVVHRVSLPDLEVTHSTDVPGSPHVLRLAPDGKIWALCDLAQDTGRLLQLDPASAEMVVEHTLPFPRPSDLAIVPVEGQSSSTVRTAWVVFDQGRYCQQLIGGRFEGEPHSFHHGALPDAEDDLPASIAVNDYGEIWLTQPGLDQVWKWPGGRMYCRADVERPYGHAFFGEYCTVSVYGGRADSDGPSPNGSDDRSE